MYLGKNAGIWKMWFEGENGPKRYERLSSWGKIAKIKWPNKKWYKDWIGKFEKEFGKKNVLKI
jgi:hypothetical protein